MNNNLKLLRELGAVGAITGVWLFIIGAGPGPLIGVLVTLRLLLAAAHCAAGDEKPKHYDDAMDEAIDEARTRQRRRRRRHRSTE